MTRPARVAHVVSTPGSIGGAERLIVELVRDGIGRGRREVVLNPFAGGDETALRNSLPPGIHRNRPGRRVRDLPAIVRWLRRELSTFQPDVVHSHLFHAEVAVAALPLRRSMRRLTTHHHGDVLLVNGRPLAQRVDDLAVRRYDVVVAVSHRGRDFLVERGLAPDRVRVVPNGVTLTTPAAATARPRGRVAVCVAHFRPEKDHENLLDAFRIVVDWLPDARLRLVGDGPLRQHLVSKAAGLKLGHHVEFVGSTATVIDHLRDADVFVLPSRYEGMSIALLEAMGAGLPAIVTDVGANPEIVDPSAGRVVPPGDSRALAEALVGLLADADLASRLGRRARAVATDYGIERTLDHYSRIYRDLVGSGPS